jgi:endonuclease/exonuclease/phosphatase family metal-dependent hydrolase
MIVSLIFALLIAFGVFLWVLQITKYDPVEKETMAIDNNADTSITLNHESAQTFSVMTYNIGYAGLGRQEDFFMDGGVKSRPDSLEIVKDNYFTIEDTIMTQSSDFIMLQEVDRNSHRSYRLDEYTALKKAFETYSASFAYNYKVLYVPVPFPPMGQVNAGQATFGAYEMVASERIALPSTYSWPKNLVMLDRCVLKTTYAIDDRAERLVLYNAHFSAYDDGTLREQQMALIKKLILESYQRGDYVILGGDWNQTFPEIDPSQFPLFDSGAFYLPYQIDKEWAPAGWQWGIDDSIPTYRLLNAPYEEGITQVGIIDGFLVSPNVSIQHVETLNLGFEASDHHPVIMKFSLLGSE